MAEKAITPHTYALTLTYAPQDGKDPDGAKAFRYRDVQHFIRAVRKEAQALQDKAKEANPAHVVRKESLRYIVAGEKGAEKGRVHWHAIFFATFDLATIGQWSSMLKKPEPMSQAEGDEEPRRQHWTMWPHGLVTVQHPDERGMLYVCKYVVKDQWSSARAKGTGREHKSETYAAGFFRMSKYPPIGTPYLQQKISEWRDGAYVPDKDTLQIPGYTGYWYPVGMQRQQMMEAIWQINAEHKAAHRADLPQYTTLKAAVGRRKQGEESAAFETLQYGIMENDPAESEAQFLNHLADKHRAQRARASAHEARRTCGGLRVCEGCWNAADNHQRKAIRQFVDEQARTYRAEHGRSAQGDELDQYTRRSGKRNPHCQRTGDVYEAAFRPS